MADRVVTFKEPTAKNIVRFIVHYADGEPSAVEYHLNISGSNGQSSSEAIIVQFHEMADDQKQKIIDVKESTFQAAKDGLGFADFSVDEKIVDGVVENLTIKGA